MKTPISVSDKKEFLRYFLNHYQLKKRECTWILNYLLAHDELMENIHFVDHVRHCPRGFELSTDCGGGEGFVFYKNGQVSHDAEKSFHEIRIHKEEDLYIQLNFKGKYLCLPYVNVQEDNPFAAEPSNTYDVIRDAAEVIITESIRTFQKNRLLLAIDAAIDHGDREQFYLLTNQLNQLGAQ